MPLDVTSIARSIAPPLPLAAQTPASPRSAGAAVGQDGNEGGASAAAAAPSLPLYDAFGRVAAQRDDAATEPERASLDLLA
jgi:hypothetical protein